MAAKVLESTYKGRDIVKITSRDDSIPMKELDNNFVIKYDGYVITEIYNEKTDETFASILVKDRETGIVYATRSDSFIKSLKGILEELEKAGDTDPVDLIVTRAKSNNGREFISCALA